MAILNRLKSVKVWLGLLWLGCALFSFGCAHDEDSSGAALSLAIFIADSVALVM